MDDENEEDVEVVSDHSSKNIFSALGLLSTPDDTKTTTDMSGTLPKFSVGVCNECVSVYVKDEHRNVFCAVCYHSYD